MAPSLEVNENGFKVAGDDTFWTGIGAVTVCVFKDFTLDEGIEPTFRVSGFVLDEALATEVGMN